MNIHKFAVDGMHCRSCELIIERKLRALAGVAKADANASKGVARVMGEGDLPGLEAIGEALKADGYSVRPLGSAPSASSVTPTKGQLFGAFAAVLLVGWLISKLGWLKSDFAVDDTAGFATVFLIGLIAASSSCIAVSGGLMLSSAAKFNERYGSSVGLAKMQPVFMFVAGRVISYGLLGGLIGALGAALTPSPTVTGLITVSAAIYMLVMGLDMLKIAPSWLKGLMPRMPKSLSSRLLDAEGKEHPLMPGLLGAATFFIPCGFTQALQIYALTTGSFARSGMLLAAFALGTAPALLALGWASTSLKGKLGAAFFRFAGALVVVLGLWNVQNGLTAMGYRLALPDFASARAAATARAAEDPNVTVKDGVQVISMKLTSGPSFYAPSDIYTVKAGMPVRMVVNGIGTGCRGVLQVPKARVSVALNKPVNVLEFTPTKPGQYVFSCSMGMFPGTLNVLPNA